MEETALAYLQNSGNGLLAAIHWAEIGRNADSAHSNDGTA
jgi:hypothetical protein